MYNVLRSLILFIKEEASQIVFLICFFTYLSPCIHMKRCHTGSPHLMTGRLATIQCYDLPEASKLTWFWSSESHFQCSATQLHMVTWCLLQQFGKKIIIYFWLLARIVIANNALLDNCGTHWMTAALKDCKILSLTWPTWFMIVIG